MKTTYSIKQSPAKTGGQLVAVMPGNKKDLRWRKQYKSFYWKQFRKKKQTNKIEKKAGRVRKKAVRKLNDQECAVYPMNRLKMHL